MSEPNLAQPLTKDDVKAIREANDYVSFHSSTPAMQGQQGTFMRLTKRMGKDALGGFSSDRDLTAHRDIPVLQHGNPEQAYVGISSPSYCPRWQTIRSLIKVGDLLEVAWRPDWFTSEIVKEAGLHADVVELTIIRGVKKKRMCFLLDVQVCRNNEARMIHPRRPEPHGLVDPSTQHIHS